MADPKQMSTERATNKVDTAPRALTALIGVVTVIGGVLLAAAIAGWGDQDETFLIAVGAAVIACEVSDFPLIKSSRVSLSLVIIMTAGVFSGFSGAVLMGCLAAAADAVAHPKPMRKALFNFGTLAATGAAFAGVLEAFAGTYDEGDWMAMMGPAPVAALVAFAVNSGLVTAAISLDNGDHPFDIWTENFLWTAPYFIFQTVVAVFAAMAYDRWELGGLLMMALPLAMAWLAMRGFNSRLSGRHLGNTNLTSPSSG
jgi:hypothetical protein